MLEQGIGPGSVVGLFSPNSLDFVTAGYGILSSGAVFTPFNSSYKQRELVHQINNSGASVVFAARQLIPRLEECRNQDSKMQGDRAGTILLGSHNGYSP